MFAFQKIFTKLTQQTYNLTCSPKLTTELLHMENEVRKLKSIKYGLTEHAAILIQANDKRFNKIIVQKLKLKILTTGANDVH